MSSSPYVIQPGDPTIGCAPFVQEWLRIWESEVQNTGAPPMLPVNSPQTPAAAPYIAGRVEDKATPPNSYTVFVLPSGTPFDVAGDMLWPGIGITQAAADSLAHWNLPVQRLIREGQNTVPAVVVAPETPNEPVPDPAIYGEVA